MSPPPAHGWAALPWRLRLLARAMQLAERRGAGLSIEEQVARPLAQRQAARPAAWGHRRGPDGIERRDVVVETRGGSLTARLHRRPGGGPAVPAIVYLHGGGWVGGGFPLCDVTCDRLAHLTGATIVSVDYRLAPEHPFPAALEDCEDVLRWLRARGAELGVDPARMAVAGESAGGNLAAALALVDRGNSPGLRAQLLVYPALDATGESAFFQAFRGPGLQREQCHTLVALYLQGADPRDPRVSPLLAPDLSGLPPALVLTGGADILAGDGESYVERLLEAGTPARLLHLARAPHAFLNFDRLLPEVTPAVESAAAFLREHLLGGDRVRA